MIHVAVDKETKATITREAKLKRVSVGWLIREAVDAYLKAAAQSKEQLANSQVAAA